MFKTMGGRSLFAGQSFDVIEAPTAGPLVAEALGGVGHHDLVAQVIQPFTQEVPQFDRWKASKARWILKNSSARSFFFVEGSHTF